MINYTSHGRERVEYLISYSYNLRYLIGYCRIFPDFLADEEISLGMTLKAATLYERSRAQTVHHKTV